MSALDKITDPNCSVTTHDIEAARAELAALRAKAAAYDEVMRRLQESPELNFENDHPDDVRDLNNAVIEILADERKAGRYVP